MDEVLPLPIRHCIAPNNLHQPTRSWESESSLPPYGFVHLETSHQPSTCPALPRSKLRFCFYGIPRPPRIYFRRNDDPAHGRVSRRVGLLLASVISTFLRGQTYRVKGPDRMCHLRCELKGYSGVQRSLSLSLLFFFLG